MADPLFTVSVLFATTTATAGFVLALLGYEIFRGAPFGRMIAFLAVILFVLAVYHALLLVIGRESVPILEAVAFTALLLWVVLMIRQHHRMAHRAADAGD